MSRKFIKAIVPDAVWRFFRACLMAVLNRLLKIFNLTAVKRNDFNSPLPDVEALRRNRKRWDRPSALHGVAYDLDAMTARLEELVQKAGPELESLPTFDELLALRLGWGMPYLDLQTLYLTLRHQGPRQYVEIGSGLSTHVARLALAKNSREGKPCSVTCIEPYPSEGLAAMQDVELIAKEVQDVEPSFFDRLGDGDVLFIDSSHIVKLDSDVPFLLLEVLPRLRPGVIIHVHDTPFPFNTPFPSDFWLFDEKVPPMFWTEAMLTQAFLSFNDSFKIILSTPLLRHDREDVLRKAFPRYQGVDAQPNTFSSLWLRRVK